MLKKLVPLFFFTSMIIIELNAQGLSGYVLNQDNEPIPYASVFIKQLRTGTPTDAQGRYYISLTNGIYDVIISSIGYTSQSFEIIIGDKDVLQKNVWLNVSNQELNEVVVSAKRKDPAYEIIQKVIENKQKYLSQVLSSRSMIYLKATEVRDAKPRKVKAGVEVSIQGNPSDPFGDPVIISNDEQANINMLEMNVVLNYEYPGKYKEERTAVKSYGSPDGLYIPNFGETDYNFYENIVELKDQAEAPIISPISRTSILSYKYKLEAIDTIEKQIVYKIKVIPRKIGNSTCKGYLYINDGFWNINKLDFSFNKSGLRFYDKFRLKQSYDQINDTLWIPNRQEFIYETKQGKRKKFIGNTIIYHSDFLSNYEFPDKYFGNEIAVTKKEAYKKDSSYWNSSRPETLTVDEQQMIQFRDSIHAAQNNTEYKDSLEVKYNKVSLVELAFLDVGFRNYKKKKQVMFSSILGSVGFEIIGGLRLGPYGSYFKRWESGRYISSDGSFSLGLKNNDLQGNGGIYFLYDPMKVGSIKINAGRSFYAINPNDAYLNQLRRSNYILADRFNITHRKELINGLYLSTGFSYTDRQSVEDLNSTTFIEDLIDDKAPIQFDDYQSLITNIELSYTPKQRYMTEPNRKVILGSNYPTFSMAHKKGWASLFSSDIDFDLLEFSIRQKFTIGVLGNSEYSLQTGKFLNTKDLRLIDQKRFRESDSYFYSDPLSTFQLLDTSLIATKPYLEAHYIHHFNGALVNNIPLVKKLRLRVVAGAGFLWIKERNYRHEEIFAGIERVFKVGKRRRIRLGLYGVAGQSNRSSPQSDFKISLDLIDTWKRDWSF